MLDAEEYCNEQGIMCSIEYVDPDSNHYNSNVNVGLIGDQSVPISTFLGNITDITFYVVNSREPISEDPDTSDEEENNDTPEENTEETTDEDIIEDMLF